jgi:hypothetical protein
MLTTAAAQDICDRERARQHAERVLMGKEDEHMQSFVSKERAMCKKERFIMAKQEEGLKVWDIYFGVVRSDKVIHCFVSASLGILGVSRFGQV